MKKAEAFPSFEAGGSKSAQARTVKNLLKHAEAGGAAIVTQDGQPKAVMLPVEMFAKLSVSADVERALEEGKK